MGTITATVMETVGRNDPCTDLESINPRISINPGRERINLGILARRCNVGFLVTRLDAISTRQVCVSVHRDQRTKRRVNSRELTKLSENRANGVRRGREYEGEIGSDRGKGLTEICDTGHGRNLYLHGIALNIKVDR